jgi:pseudouridine-5'-phosphate glycosidase
MLMGMKTPSPAVSSEVAEALRLGKPVVALESTLIAHGLPWPLNLETALECEQAVRAEGVIPATIAVWKGVPTVGLDAGQLRELAQANDVLKTSRRDLGFAIATGRTAATTVSATMALAHRVGIKVFATGGIGGAHRTPAWDVSADLIELSRTPVLVVCAGAKSILDIPRTLEILETHGVPVWGYRTDTFPLFYTAGGREPVNARFDEPLQAAEAFAAHVSLGGGGAVLAQPLDEAEAIPEAEFEKALRMAEAEAELAGISGPKVTPFLLKRIAELTGGKTLAANRKLIVGNAKLAAQVAGCFSGCR